MPLRQSMIRLLVGCACLAAPVTQAQAQPAVPGTRPPAPAASVDPEMEAARLAWEAFPLADRRAAQDALVWTNDYTGVNDGVFGRRTRDALVAFKTRNGQKSDGILSRKDLDLLLAAGRRARDAARFTQIADDPSGAVAFLPMALLLISGLLMLLYPITRTRHVAIRRVLDRRLVAMSGGDECPIGQAGALHFAQNPKD